MAGFIGIPFKGLKGIKGSGRGDLEPLDKGRL
jgi:hypothetical protein